MKKLVDWGEINCESDFTKSVPQKILAYNEHSYGLHLYIEQRAYIAKELEKQGYGNLYDFSEFLKEYVRQVKENGYDGIGEIDIDEKLKEYLEKTSTNNTTKEI